PNEGAPATAPVALQERSSAATAPARAGTDANANVRPAGADVAVSAPDPTAAAALASATRGVTAAGDQGPAAPVPDQHGLDRPQRGDLAGADPAAGAAGANDLPAARPVGEGAARADLRDAPAAAAAPR